MKIEIGNAYIMPDREPKYYEMPNTVYDGIYFEVDNADSILIECINSGKWNIKVDDKILTNMVVQSCEVIGERDFKMKFIKH